MKQFIASASIRIAPAVTPNRDANTINEIIANALIKYIIPLAGALAVAFVIYGGVLYITSGGDPEKTGKAKKTLLWAIAGVFLIALSYAIVKMIGSVIKYNIL